MNRGILAGATLALALIVAGPQAADAQTLVWGDYDVCAEASFNPCVDFELYNSGGLDYFFRVTYLGSLGDPEGAMTATGLYDYDGDGSPFEFSNVTLDEPTDGDWNLSNSDGCSQLSGGGPTFFEGCVDTDDGINSGVAPGGYIQFSFTSNQTIAGSNFASNGGELGARAHIQGVDEEQDCSFKLDSPDGLVSGCSGPIVPEPMTVILMATGLVGVGVVGYRNRRREDEEA